jgi:putative effector of murein hydrolase
MFWTGSYLFVGYVHSLKNTEFFGDMPVMKIVQFVLQPKRVWFSKPLYNKVCQLNQIWIGLHQVFGVLVRINTEQDLTWVRKY